MLSKFIKVIAIILMLGVLAYAGSCVYVNFFQNDSTVNTVELPPVEQALYWVKIKSNGNLLFTDTLVLVQGNSSDNDVYILEGYWELVKGRYLYRLGKIRLDEAIFGEITVGTGGNR